MDNPIRYEDKNGDTPGGGGNNPENDALFKNNAPEGGGGGGGGGTPGMTSAQIRMRDQKASEEYRLKYPDQVSTTPAANKGGKTFTTVKTEAGDKREVGTYKELRDAKLKDGHHVIQDATVRDIPGYNKKDAPAVRLDGPSYKIGSEHYKATQAQRKGGGGTYASERRAGYKALRTAGLTKEGAREVIKTADAYFKSLGVTPSTPTRIPGNRKK